MRQWIAVAGIYLALGAGTPSVWASGLCAGKLANVKSYTQKGAGGQKIAQYSCKNGKLTGNFKRWHENGQLKTQGKFSNGQFSGRWQRYYADGKLRDTGMWKKGKPDGQWKLYQPNGKPKAVGNYRDGETIGRWALYDRNGKRRASGGYACGEKAGVWTEKVNGKLKKISYGAGGCQEQANLLAFRASGVAFMQTNTGRSQGPLLTWNPIYHHSPNVYLRGSVGATIARREQVGESLSPRILVVQGAALMGYQNSWLPIALEIGAGYQWWNGIGIHPIALANVSYRFKRRIFGLVKSLEVGVTDSEVASYRTFQFRAGVGIEI